MIEEWLTRLIDYLNIVFILSFVFLQLVQKEVGISLLQSLGHSLHSRERLIQVGEVMRGDRTQSCTRQSDLLPLRLARHQISQECCLSLKSLYALKVAVPELHSPLCAQHIVPVTLKYVFTSFDRDCPYF